MLYDDGSLLSLRTRPAITVTPLTTAGVAMVVERLEASGLFESSRNIPWKPRPMGFGLFAVSLVRDGSTIRVSASNLGDDPDSRALVDLAEGLMDPGRWLPAEAFANGRAEARSYLPRAVRVTSEIAPLARGDWTNAAQSIDRVAWPLDTPPMQLGEPVELPGGSGRTLRCGVVDGADEHAIRAALAFLESDTAGSDGRSTGWYLWLPEPALLRLTLHAFLPDESPGCTVDELPGAPSLANAPRPSLFALLAVSSGGLTPAGRPRFFVRVGRPNDGATLAFVAYYADGTLLFHDPPAPAVGIGARRLSAAGLEQVQQALDASGLLRDSYTEAVPDNATPNRMYSIVTDTVILNGTDRGRDPVATAIAKLGAQLADPVAWLPATAWTVDSLTIQPYRPASVRLTIYPQGSPVTALPRISTLVWPLGGTLDAFGTPDETLPDMDARTDQLPPDAALAVLRALMATGARSSGGFAHAEYHLAADRPGVIMVFEFTIDAGEGVGE